MTPSVDVIVPCFNYGRMLAGCVASICSQTEVNVRVLIMDDASSDDTPAVARALSARDSRVEYRRHEVNRGHLATYNAALDLVRADYCLILSPDDMLTPGALRRAAGVMEVRADVGLVYGRDITFRDAPSLESVRASDGFRVVEYEEFLEAACRLGHTGIQSPTAVVRTRVHRAVGYYRMDLPHSGDTEIWLRIAEVSNVAALDADQAFRRLHAHSMSLTYSALERLAEQRRAFDAHFDALPGRRHHVARLRLVAYETIAEAAFWQGARAFENGDDDGCEKFLDYAASLRPAIMLSKHWRRLRWKRRFGRPAARIVSRLTMRRAS
jgi:glycosyltransferase involved in cell wall biosynthesis